MGKGFQRLLGHRGLTIGLVLLGLIFAMAIFAPLLSPFDPYDQDLSRRLIPPFWSPKANPAHLLGTDNLGRDYLSRILYGARISLLIGFAVMLISGLIGTTLGLLAGYFGGRVDLAITFLITTRLAIPVVLVALAVVAMIGGSLLVVILVLGLLKWDRIAVVMRAATQQVRGLDYIAAAEAAGASVPQLLAVLRQNENPYLVETLSDAAAPCATGAPSSSGCDETSHYKAGG